MQVDIQQVIKSIASPTGAVKIVKKDDGNYALSTMVKTPDVDNTKFVETEISFDLTQVADWERVQMNVNMQSRAGLESSTRVLADIQTSRAKILEALTEAQQPG